MGFVRNENDQQLRVVRCDRFLQFVDDRDREIDSGAVRVRNIDIQLRFVPLRQKSLH